MTIVRSKEATAPSRGYFILNFVSSGLLERSVRRKETIGLNQ